MTGGDHLANLTAYLLKIRKIIFVRRPIRTPRGELLN
jgi:hypothetical protein